MSNISASNSNDPPPVEQARLDAQVQELLRRARARAQAALAARGREHQAPEVKPRKTAKEQRAALDEWIARRNAARPTDEGGAG